MREPKRFNVLKCVGFAATVYQTNKLIVRFKGKPNRCREQVLQNGAVRIVHMPYRIVLNRSLNRVIEALTDKKTWLFALFAALDNVPNSITNQLQIIISSFGFTTFQTTLLGCVTGVIEMLTIYSGVTIASRIPDSRAWVAIIYFVPNILSVFLVNFLPWHDKVGLLFSVWLSGMHHLLWPNTLKELR